MKKQYVLSALFCVLAATLAMAGGAGEKEEVTVTVAVNFPPTETTFVNLNDIAVAYSEMTKGVTVELVTYSDYEPTMKTKMAAQDLPDAWSTHGWSVARYSEYLAPLTNRSWVSKVNPMIKPVITDAEGDIFVLPLDVDVAGVVFNKDILDEAGVDPMKIKTWDDFKAASAKISALGKIPVHIGGSPKDDWTVGNFYDWVAPSYLITNESKNYRSEMKDGSFDWTLWGPVASLLTDFRDAGYLNPDYTQGTWADVGRKMGAGEVAFGLFGNYLVAEAKKAGPDGNYGFMPVPSASSDDEPSLITGERTAIGVWADGPAVEETMAFIDFLAQPENINLVAAGNSIPTGLVGAGYVTDAGELTSYFDAYADVRGFPYFDREYLPSGMWDSMCKTGTGLLSGTMTLPEAIQKMRDDYNSFRAQ